MLVKNNFLCLDSETVAFGITKGEVQIINSSLKQHQQNTYTINETALETNSKDSDVAERFWFGKFF